MIIVIRISGMVEIPGNIQEALFRIRLRRKYTAVLIKDNAENQKMLKKIRSYVAYGTIDSKTLQELIAKRAVPVAQKSRKDIKVDKIIEQIESGKLNDIKPYFRLHPPVGGIDSKIHFPVKKGVLGDNKEKINDLIRRML